MSINDIYDGIEHQEVWASWNSAYRKNIDTAKTRESLVNKALSGLQGG